MALSKDPKLVSMKVIRMVTMPVSDCRIGEIMKEGMAHPSSKLDIRISIVCMPDD